MLHVRKAAPEPKADAVILTSPVAQKKLMESTLLAAATDSAINRHETIYPYIEKYRPQGIDIVAWYEQHKKTRKVDQIKDNFVHNNEGYVGARLMETLPLFANKDGRLGEYVKARVTKTAKQDDQGNDFIDLVIEMENAWLEKDAPKELRDSVPGKMTFLVDTTVANNLSKKMYALQDEYLIRGKKANVKCFTTQTGMLGIDRPKLIVAKTSNFVEEIGQRLGDCITQVAGDKYNINKPAKFDEIYQGYFKEFAQAMKENAEENIRYMRRLVVPDPKRELLITEYKKIIAFLDAYQKTPVRRTRTT